MAGSLPVQFFLFFKALFRLTRFWNLIIIGIAQYFTAYFLVGYDTLTDWRLLLLSVSTMMIAAAGYIINDYYDVKIDLINKPERVVIGKSITRRYAIFFHTVLSLSGVAVGLLLSWQIALVNFMSAFLLWLYSNNLKRQPFIGNFAIGLLTAFSVLVVNLLYQPFNSLILIYALFALAMTLVREIIKDMEDWKGDNTFGCKTIPIIWGLRKTKLLLYVLLILFTALVIMVNTIYVGLPIYYFIAFLFLPLGYLVARLIRADTIRDFARLSSLCKLILLLGIISMSLV
ncbi:MAG TPA: prenyltransferase [Cytophagales bacterium]|nr:prenyltransferase [Cytophagales bacterium]HCR54852.1 prenyltransferase [Cytophagales bacterium]